MIYGSQSRTSLIETPAAIFAAGIEPADAMELTRAHLVIHDPDQNRSAVQDIAARQSSIAADRKRVITHAGRTSYIRLSALLERFQPDWKRLSSYFASNCIGPGSPRDLG